MNIGFHKGRNAWRAYIRVFRKDIHLGYFATKEEAQEEADEAMVRRLEKMPEITKIMNYIKYGWRNNAKLAK